MNIMERIKSLLPHGEAKTIAELERDCGISNGTIGKWGVNTYSPTTNNLEKLADYFNVTTDYLLGRTDNPFPPELHNAKLALYDSVFAGLDDADIDALKQMAKHLRDKGNM